MASHLFTHPSADVLKSFALGKLDDHSTGLVIGHLEQCEMCRKEVAAQSGDDFLIRLRQAHGRGSPPALSKGLSQSAALANLPPELAANQQYEILKELGRGGMGVVYLAKNKPMDRLEVLKVINKALLDRPGAAERFLREIRSAAKLNHVNVVAAYSVPQLGGLLAFAMEYVDGQDLASLVKAQGPLPVTHACFYVQQAALGLQHAFEKNMVHRDIKPQNLMLMRDGKKHIVKVLDFGLAKVMREKSDDTGLTGEGQMLGTPDYIAPEQSLDAAKADIRADIYSLGCTLYYLLAGRPPFSGSSMGAVLLAHQMQEAKPLNLVRPEVPEELAAIVRKMMVKVPAKRYQTPLEVVQALGLFVKQGAKPKPSLELSMGPGVAPPPLPPRQAPPREASPVAWETLTDGSIAPTPSRKSGAVRKRRSPVADKDKRTKWFFGGGIGVALLLLTLVVLWANGFFTWKMPDKIAESSKEEPAKLPKAITNSLGMRFAWCPPGTFQMGSPPGEEQRSEDESQHKVTLTKGFYLGIHEVTQAQWRAVMGNNPSNFKGDNLPVETVSWEDCQEFCTNLGKPDGKRYRLPTEAEWEYACRADTKTAYCFGDDPMQLADYAWYGANSNSGTHEVGTKKPNPWGFFDMHGNVWEWCQDSYGPYSPGDIKDPQSINNSDARVLRGGSWLYGPEWCRAARRSRSAPGYRDYSVGCRVVFCLD